MLPFFESGEGAQEGCVFLSLGRFGGRARFPDEDVDRAAGDWGGLLAVRSEELEVLVEEETVGRDDDRAPVGRERGVQRAREARGEEVVAVLVAGRHVHRRRVHEGDVAAPQGRASRRLCAPRVAK